MAATVAKAVFGLIISSFVAFRISAHIAAGYFQLLTLQSAFITFISGAAFVRGAKASSSDASAASLVRFQLMLVVGSLITCAILLELLLPEDYLGIPPEAQAVVTGMLLVSGVSSALTGLLQGLLVRHVGRAAVFMPVVISNLLGCAALGLLWTKGNILLMTSVVAGVQLLILLQLVVSHRQVRCWIASLRGAQVYSNDFSTMYFGLVNTVFMIAMFAVREIWKDHQSAMLASRVFFILRISDTAFQVPMLFFGSSIESVEWLELRAARTIPAMLRTVSSIGGLVILALLVLKVLSVDLAAASLFSIIVAQIFVDAVRLPAAGANLSMLMLDEPLTYSLTTLCGTVVIGAGLFFAGLLNDAAGLYLYLVGLAAGQIMGALFGVRAKQRRLKSNVAELPR